jgi:class 3 adenylate cyclase
MRPETAYARAGEINIAYQLLGEGPTDILLVPEFWHSIEAQWDEPSLARFLERLASFGRLICFDKRGCGISDPVAIEDMQSLDPFMDDIRAVLDAAGSERAVFVTLGGGCLPSILFAATYPQRAAGLVIINGFARLTEAPDYPIGRSHDLEQQMLDLMRAGWGRGVFLDQVAPSKIGNDEFLRWWARYQRLGASPGTILSMRRMFDRLDVRDILQSVRVPTLVLHRIDNTMVRIDHGRYIAERIPGARLVELPGRDYFVFLGDDQALQEIERLVSGTLKAAATDRVLATMLFTDIVASTKRAAELGDRAWTDLVRRHHALVRRELERFRGREVDTAGDGFFATFDGPARAVQCALEIRGALDDLGLQIRGGLHTGELELENGGVRGLAVHIAQRVMARAEPGEILVSSTVKDLVVGSGIELEDRGLHALKGVPDEWRLFAARGAALRGELSSP